jgi:hypothetical protein
MFPAIIYGRSVERWLGWRKCVPSVHETLQPFCELVIDANSDGNRHAGLRGEKSNGMQSRARCEG